MQQGQPRSVHEHLQTAFAEGQLMKALTMLLAAASLIAAPAAQAAPQVQSYDVAVALQSGKVVQRYRTSALVVSFPANYRAQIAYVGGKRAYSGTYNDLPELMAS